MTRAGRRARQSRRRRRWRVVGAACGIALVVAAGWLVVVRRSGGDSASAPRVVAPSGTTSAVPPTTTTAATPAAPTTVVVPGPPYGVGVSSTAVEDPTRGTRARGPTPASSTRRLELTVRYPARVDPGTTAMAPEPLPTRFPLLVFAHGYAITVGDYGEFLDGLAAQGFVVVAPDFPMSSNVFPGPAARAQSDIDEQSRDVAFLVDQFLGDRVPGPWAGHVRPGEAGVVGHSDGANTVARAAMNSCCFTDRIGAAAVIAGDSTSTGEWAVTGAAPLLFLQGTADNINAYSNIQALYEVASTPKWLVAVEGGNHFEPFTPGSQRDAIVALVAAFLRGHLGEPAELDRIRELAEHDTLRLVASS